MISVLIITRERQELLKKCLNSLRPWCDLIDMQTIVIVNGPDQVTENFLTHFDFPGLEWKVLPNHELPGTARNAGLPLVKGEWTYFIDDDARVAPGYLEYWLKTSRSLPEAQVIGGPDSAPPESSGMSRAVSLTLSSPLCTGATFHRHSSKGLEAVKADETRLTSCNLWVRSHWWYKGVHFPENFRRGEETVLINDLCKRTPHVWWVPGLEVWHSRRKDLTALAKASFGGGYHRAKILRKDGGPAWFWLAPLFVLLHLSVMAMPPAFYFFVVVWLAGVLLISTKICSEAKQLKLLPLVVFLHWWILFTYGAGFWQNLSEWGQE